jgi:hypothetical protein
MLAREGANRFAMGEGDRVANTHRSAPVVEPLRLRAWKRFAQG